MDFGNLAALLIWGDKQVAGLNARRFGSFTPPSNVDFLNAVNTSHLLVTGLSAASLHH